MRTSADTMSACSSAKSSDRSAALDTDQRGAVDVQDAQQRGQVFDVGIARPRRRRLAEAAPIIANHPVLAGERGDLIVPDATVETRAVDEDDRRAGAARFVVQRAVFDRRHSRRRRRRIRARSQCRKERQDGTVSD
jgi:hypothetical protein